MQRRKEDRDNRYTNVMRALVWRYVSATHRRYDDEPVTEDDINEVKADISAMRYEMLAIFEKNGMDVSSAERKERAHLAKRMKIWERRLMKDFQVAPVAGEEERDDEGPRDKGIARFRRVAQQVVSQTSSRRWTEAVQGVTDTQIGRCHNRQSFKNQQNLQKAINEAKRFVIIYCGNKSNELNVVHIVQNRLVQKSPSLSSRPESPVEFYDPTRETLLALLKNITEEAGEVISTNVSLLTPKINRQPSPVQLTKQLVDILSNQTNVLDTKSISSRKSCSTDRRPSLNSDLNGGKLINNSESSLQAPASNLTVTNSKSAQELDKTGRSPKTDVPTIQITKTDSQRLQKKTSRSKESLNSTEGSSSSSVSAVGKMEFILILYLIR